MGNVLLDDQRRDNTVENFDRWLEQNPSLSNRSILAQNKTFRTCSFYRNNRKIVLKIYFRRQSQIKIKQYLKTFEIIQQVAEELNCCHIMPLRLIQNKQTAALTFVSVCRQFIHNTLQNKLQARTKLHSQSKRWIIFQMILAIYTLHKDFNLYHGNIRTSNFLITTSEYLILTDFASYKPLYINQANEKGLSEFRLFYGSSIDKCNFAPEKMTGDNQQISENEMSPINLFEIYTRQTIQKDKIQESMRFSVATPRSRTKPENNITEGLKIYEYNEKVAKLKAMDIFSLGCCILEVLNNGKPILTYEKLLKFKKGELQLKTVIQQTTQNLLKGDKIKEMIHDMLNNRPTARLQIGQVLQIWLKIVNEEVYFLLWHCISAFSTTSFHLPDLRICLIFEIFQFIQKQIKKTNYHFQSKRPHCLQSFKALKIFVGILKNKIIPTIINNPQHLLSIIIAFIEKSENNQPSPNSELRESQQFMNQSILPTDFPKFKSKRSTVIQTQGAKQELCPPQYANWIIALIQPKIRGSRLSLEQQAKNRMQDNLIKIKKNQGYRQQRINEKSNYYQKYQLAFKVIFSCIRGCKYVNSKLVGIQLLSLLARQSSDATKLRLFHPYLISLMEDSDLSVAKYSFHYFIDSFYWFIDPFENQEDTKYYSYILQTIINKINSQRLRVTVFQRLTNIYQICQWMQLHCLRFSQKIPKNNLRNLIELIKASYGAFNETQRCMLMTNLPNNVISEILHLCISFFNTEKMLGFKLSSQIAQAIDCEVHKKMIQTIDNCMESGLDETSIALQYSIKYFCLRKVTTKVIIRKICPLIIHPHLWVRRQALNYVNMCLRQFPPTKVFFLFRQVFEPPFPLLSKDIGDQILLPQMLQQSQVDFKEKKYSQSLQRKIGLTQRLFQQYLKRTRDQKGDIKGYPYTKTNQIEDWKKDTKRYRQPKDLKLETTIDFRLEVKAAIQQLFETNFLYYMGIIKTKSNSNDKQKGYEELVESCRKYSKFSLEDLNVTHEKKVFFESLLAIINSNFQKLLKRMNKQFFNDKIKIVNCIYLIPTIIYKFDQFQIHPSLKLGDFYRKPTQFQKIQKPKGLLVSEIFEHKGSISCLQKIADVFFLSGSSDGTVRIFNSKKIQTNIVTDSQGYYDCKSQMSSNNLENCKVTSLCSFSNSFSLAAGTSKGQVKILNIERMSGRSDIQRMSRVDNIQITKYNYSGQIQKLATFHDMGSDCFCFATAQGFLGIQDVRMKTKTLSHQLGKERGLPRALCVSATDSSILIGTIDGYLLTYDIRCNIISQVLQLSIESQSTPILSIQPAPIREMDTERLYMVTYPSKNYQFSYFNIYSERQHFHPQRHFSSISNQILVSPEMVNKTKIQNFKLCNNTLTQKIYYRTLKNFNTTFNILDYLSDPMTERQAKIKSKWMDDCRHRYNQITSVYNKKSLPFIEVLPSGLLTNLNPTITNNQQSNFMQQDRHLTKKLPFTLLIQRDRRQSGNNINKDNNEIERYMTEKPNNFDTFLFPEQQSTEYFTCCKALQNFVVAGGRNSVIKIYK